MMKKGGPSEEVQAVTTANFKFYGEGWTKEILEKHTEPKTITEPTDSYMITSVCYCCVPSITILARNNST